MPFAPLRRSFFALRCMNFAPSINCKVNRSPINVQYQNADKSCKKLFSTSYVTFDNTHKLILLPQVPPDTESTNALLESYKKGLPNLKNISERDCYFGLGKALLEFESAVGALEEKIKGGETDFNKLFIPLDEAKCQFEKVWNSVCLLHMTTDILDKDTFLLIHTRAQGALGKRFSSDHIHSALLSFKRKHLQAKTGKDVLNNEELQLLERYITEYRERGFEVSKAKKDEIEKHYIKKINEQLRDYNFRIQVNTERYRQVIDDPDIVKDFPEDLLKNIAEDSSQPSKGPWTITLHPYIFKKFLEYCPKRPIRWSAYYNSITLASSKTETTQNLQYNVKKIEELRGSQAACLGHHSYAELVLKSKMAKSPENVFNLIDNLSPWAREAQETELEELQNFAISQGFKDDLAEFDVPFFRRKQKATIYGFDDEELRDYFPLPKVLKGVFALCHNIFGVHFEDLNKDPVATPDSAGIENLEQTSTNDAYHQDVQVFRIVDDKSLETQGHFYLDPYIRDDKAYFGSDRGLYIPMTHHNPHVECSALGSMLFSFPQPDYGKPALLSISEVEEIFRCMGNLLLHMLSKRQFSDLSGKMGIEKDAANVVQHFMTRWLYVPEILQSLSGHWSSNEQLSDKIIEQICASKTHMAGYDLCHELFKSAYDLSFYDEVPKGGMDFWKVKEELRPQYLLLPMEKDDGFPLHFQEIICGSNPGSYYSDLWSRMLAADCFSAVQEACEINSANLEEIQHITGRFRWTFLSLGSSLPAEEIFRKFRGRDPNHLPFLHELGLKKDTIKKSPLVLDNNLNISPSPSSS